MEVVREVKVHGVMPDQIITWGGPVAASRWDPATDVDVSVLFYSRISSS